MPCPTQLHVKKSLDYIYHTPHFSCYVSGLPSEGRKGDTSVHYIGTYIIHVLGMIKNLSSLKNPFGIHAEFGTLILSGY